MPELSVGDEAATHGMGAGMSGLRGVIVCYNASQGRFMFELPSGDMLSLRPDNLRPCYPVVDGMASAEGSGTDSSWHFVAPPTQSQLPVARPCQDPTPASTQSTQPDSTGVLGAFSHGAFSHLQLDAAAATALAALLIGLAMAHHPSLEPRVALAPLAVLSGLFYCAFTMRRETVMGAALGAAVFALLLFVKDSMALLYGAAFFMLVWQFGSAKGQHDWSLERFWRRLEGMSLWEMLMAAHLLEKVLKIAQRVLR